jgi:hypothetical protein
LTELLVGRLRDVAGLRRPERDIVDAALLALKLIDGVEPGGRHGDIAGDGIDDLTAQRQTALLGDEALLGEAGVEERVLKAGAVE